MNSREWRGIPAETVGISLLFCKFYSRTIVTKKNFIVRFPVNFCCTNMYNFYVFLFAFPKYIHFHSYLCHVLKSSNFNSNFTKARLFQITIRFEKLDNSVRTQNRKIWAGKYLHPKSCNLFIAASSDTVYHIWQL